MYRAAGQSSLLYEPHCVQWNVTPVHLILLGMHKGRSTPATEISDGVVTDFQHWWGTHDLA